MSIEEINIKYPYLNPQNSVDWAYGNCDECSWYNEVDSGWRKIFIDMCDEINKVLTDNGVPLTNLIVHQVKEKYGTLRFYYGIEECPKEVDDEIYEITEKYEGMSYNTCVVCGKPAKYISRGWICPYCEDCVKSCKSYTLI